MRIHAHRVQNAWMTLETTPAVMQINDHDLFAGGWLLFLALRV
jgi:hypothetical protein